VQSSQNITPPLIADKYENVELVSFKVAPESEYIPPPPAI